ncbi:MAG: hypothetical protein R3B70_01475 [Polyangiaceae bacterium]
MSTATAVASGAEGAGPAVEIDAVVGLRDLPVGKSTRKDFVAKLGEPAEVVKHGTYSFALEYKQGIRATYCQADKEERIRWVSVQAPFRAFVSGGPGGGKIVLGQSTMREAKSALGECQWSTSDKSLFWSCAFAQDGAGDLSFFVDRDLTVPHFPLDEARHIDRRVVKIQVSEKGAGCD